MARKRYPPTDPREWLNRAKSNLAAASESTPGVYLEDRCFDAQQAAEKAIKAVFIHRSLPFPYIHDLKCLLRLLSQSGVKVPKYVSRAEDLTQYAFEARYPGHSLAVKRREHQRAVRIAARVVSWAERLIATSRPES